MSHHYRDIATVESGEGSESWPAVQIYKMLHSCGGAKFPDTISLELLVRFPRCSTTEFPDMVVFEWYNSKDFHLNFLLVLAAFVSKQVNNSSTATRSKIFKEMWSPSSLGPGQPWQWLFHCLNLIWSDAFCTRNWGRPFFRLILVGHHATAIS